MKKIINYIFCLELRLPLLLIFIGVTLRIFLMPLTAHPDLFGQIHIEYYWIHFGIFKISQLADVVQALYLRLAQPIFFGSALPTIFRQFYPSMFAPYVNWFSIVSEPMAMRTIFFNKLPYLFFDIAALLILFKIFKERKQRVVAAALWAFNPLILYAVYIWGRYEIYSIFFIFCAIYYAKERKAFFSILLFGLAVALRFPAIMILPFFIIYFSSNWKDAVKYSILGILPWLVADVLLSIWGPSSQSFYESYGFLNYFFSTKIPGQFSFSEIGINIIAYPALLWFFFQERKKGINFKKLIYFSVISFLTVFSFSYFHPQYLTWITPYCIVAAVINRKIIIPFILGIISFFILINYFLGEDITNKLFMPIYPIIASSIPKFLFLPFGGSNILVAHSLFVLFNIIIIIILIKDFRAVEKN